MVVDVSGDKDMLIKIAETATGKGIESPWRSLKDFC
jgi:hypothetical protein